MKRGARAAIVGCGRMGVWHAKALARTGARVALAVDLDIERARWLASRHRGCAATSSIEELPAHSVTVAHVCTPIAAHDEDIRAALIAGCHVLVEKPLANDEAATRTLVDLAEVSQLLLCPVHQLLFQRGVTKTLASLNHLRPIHVDLVMCSAGADGRPQTEDHLVSEILPHPLSFLGRVLPEAARSGQWTVSGAGRGELRATLASQAGTASVLISTRGRPTVNAARVIGERATAHLDFFHGFAVFQGGRVSRAHKVLQPLVYSGRLGCAALANLIKRGVRAQGAYPGLWELVQAFYAQLGPGGTSPITRHETLLVAAMRDTVLSARSAMIPYG